MRRAAARALALVAVSSVVSTCLAKVYPPDVSPFCRARASGGPALALYNNPQMSTQPTWQVRTAVVMPHGDFVYAPQLIDYKNGSRELHTAAQVMIPAPARRLSRVFLSAPACVCVCVCVCVHARVRARLLSAPAKP